MGIPFSTVKCIKREPPQPEQKSTGLGTQSAEHIFDISKYLAYQQAKEDVLSSCIGHAVIMKGGIIWQLAKDIVKVKAVTKGPAHKGEGKIIGHFSGYVLVDDYLKEADEDKICGVYHMATGI